MAAIANISSEQAAVLAALVADDIAGYIKLNAAKYRAFLLEDAKTTIKNKPHPKKSALKIHIQN